MNKELEKFIFDLSKNDKKTLGQKTLKLSEEVGELAKAVLPYENAYATTHRFIRKEKILEEVADSMLVAQSIAYELGFTYQDIIDMMKEKSLKWANLQKCEDQITYPVPYEIHLTVWVNKDINEIDRFKKSCEEIGIKPVLLDLHTRNGVTKDLMSSSIFYGDNAGAYNEMKRLSELLQKRKHNVIREKIETVPWHPAAPSIKYNRLEMPKGCYFESHVAVITNEKDLPLLKDLSGQHSAVLSRNIFKKITDDEFVIMTTLRSYTLTYEEFKKSLDMFTLSLRENNFNIKKEITEFSIFDSDITHDKEWMCTDGKNRKEE